MVIETPFLLRDAAGEWHELEPGTGSRLAPVLGLFMRTVIMVEVRDHGALALTFDDGSELFAGPDPRYESWHLSGHGVEDILVGPGGHTDWQQDLADHDETSKCRCHTRTAFPLPARRHRERASLGPAPVTAGASRHASRPSR